MENRRFLKNKKNVETSVQRALELSELPSDVPKLEIEMPPVEGAFSFESGPTAYVKETRSPERFHRN